MVLSIRSARRLQTLENGVSFLRLPSLRGHDGLPYNDPYFITEHNRGGIGFDREMDHDEPVHVHHPPHRPHTQHPLLNQRAGAVFVDREFDGLGTHALCGSCRDRHRRHGARSRHQILGIRAEEQIL